MGVGIVLHVAVELQVRRHVEPRPETDQIFCEAPLAQPADIALTRQLEDHERRRPPARRDLQLIEYPVIKASEAPRVLPAEAALLGRPGLEPETGKRVRAGRNDHALADLERLVEPLPLRD